MAFNFFRSKEKKAGTRPTTKDYEALGKQVAALYDHINPDRRGLYRTAFLKGIVTGLGGVIGATLVIVVLAWILTLLGQVPFVGPIFEKTRDTIQKEQSQEQ
jgi:hypothetical protein